MHKYTPKIYVCKPSETFPENQWLWICFQHIMRENINTEKLFGNLEISQDQSYKKHLNQYDVFKD